MSEKVLTEVTETHRSGENYYIKAKMDCGFIFASHDESIMVSFQDVSAYIEYDHEWADFNAGSFSLSFSNEQSDNLPHWLYEEFSHIEHEGCLRPIDDYETNYSLKENRATKGIK